MLTLPPTFKLLINILFSEREKERGDDVRPMQNRACSQKGRMRKRRLLKIITITCINSNRIFLEYFHN